MNSANAPINLPTAPLDALQAVLPRATLTVQSTNTRFAGYFAELPPGTPRCLWLSASFPRGVTSQTNRFISGDRPIFSKNRLSANRGPNGDRGKFGADCCRRIGRVLKTSACEQAVQMVVCREVRPGPKRDRSHVSYHHGGGTLQSVDDAEADAGRGGSCTATRGGSSGGGRTGRSAASSPFGNRHQKQKGMPNSSLSLSRTRCRFLVRPSRHTGQRSQRSGSPD